MVEEHSKRIKERARWLSIVQW